MFLHILIALGLGVFLGIFTGLTPGLHVNLVCALVMASLTWLLGITSPFVLCCFIVSLSITHTFFDIIPSVFLGAPDEATSMGVLPGHRMLLKGEGFLAVKLATIGSLGATILSAIAFPIFTLLMGAFYNGVKSYIGYLLMLMVIVMLIREHKRIWALCIFLLSGFIGLVCFSIPNIEPLFPMLSGMFGAATLLYSLSNTNKIPIQEKGNQTEIDFKQAFKTIVAGELSGFLTAVLPGLSAGIAAIISLQFLKKIGDQGFMLLIGSINTVNFMLSLVALFVIDKARNGSIVALQALLGRPGVELILAFMSCAMITAGVATISVLNISKVYAKYIVQINYRRLCLSVIAFIGLLVTVMAGPVGIVIFVSATGVGMIPALTKVSRTFTMGCIILPAILYYF